MLCLEPLEYKADWWAINGFMNDLPCKLDIDYCEIHARGTKSWKGASGCERRWGVTELQNSERLDNEIRRSLGNGVWY